MDVDDTYASLKYVSVLINLRPLEASCAVLNVHVSRRYMRVLNKPERLVVCLSEYLPQCPKLRVHPAPGVHISAAGCTIFGGVHPECALFLNFTITTY